MNIVPKTPVADFLFLFLFVLPCCLFGHRCYAIDTISSRLSIRDGRETLISQDDNFELGFFSPPNSTLRYVGIWYYKIEVKPVVWVANRDAPISDRNGVLRIGNDGNLEILDANNTKVWTSNASVPSSNTSATLWGTANFVLSSIGDTKNTYWQSFDHPTDTYLPEMRVLVSTVRGENHALSSWKSANDPSPGNFSIGVDPFAAPQIVIWNQTRRMWRSGQWNGVVFTGLPNLSSFASFLYGFRLSDHEADGSMYFTYTSLNASDFIRFRIGWDGKEEQLMWDDGLKSWAVLQSSEPVNDCDLYNFCGNFGVCDITKSPKCSCVQGFKPKNTEEWSRRIWNSGCVRRTPLQCSRTDGISEVRKEDGFLKLKMKKMPDFSIWASSTASEYTCRYWCLINCSCVAYAYATGIGCLLWDRALIDNQKFSGGGVDLYIRLAYSEFDRQKETKLIIIITVTIGGSIIVFISVVFIRRRMAKGRVRKKNSGEMLLLDGGKTSVNEVELQDLPWLKFEELASSTNNFNLANLLGQGGFGPVFKGTLQNGQEIAVKRLSRASGQGLEEFMNEVLVISRLQHRNLVSLLGCCVEGEEKILVYEYMPNKSLDSYLFDPLKKGLLDWRKRFNIIEGISQGLLYLHRHSRLRIIHRDLKASNILLDEMLQPKISDFGLARIFGDNEDQANTRRVVGTYGYMPPEYAMEGLFSEKSDVYSYGVLLLEIVSGRRNTGFYNDEHLSLVGYVWKLWNGGKILALVDNKASDACSPGEVLRCIHVGLLCVQEFAKDRPNMSTVISMLNSEIVDLPSPKQPAFTLRQNIASNVESPSQNAQQRCSINNVTLSTIKGR